MEKELLSETKEKMGKVLDFLKQEWAAVRVGRASPSLVENVKVLAYGAKMRVLELAYISTPEPNQILIKPYDVSNAENIRKAIFEANLGLNPVAKGELIRIAVSPLTAERREELVKLINQRLEGARISIRQIRQEAMKQIDQAFEEKQLSEDQKFRLREKVQEIVDEFNEKVENLGKSKEQELLAY